MGDVDFAMQFCNIEGDLISERKKNFFKLLRSTPALTEEELKNVHPRNYLEGLFYVDTLIYFKKTNKLLEILKDGNEVFISKILKQPWLFKEAFKDISANELVNEFLPYTSFAKRMNVLKKISIILNESQMDDVFDRLYEREEPPSYLQYSNKIEKLLSVHEICLQPNQVKAIFDKDPDLFVKYLEHYKQVKGKTYGNSNVSRHISRKNLEFWLLMKKTNSIQGVSYLGHRISKKAVDFLTPDVVGENINTYTGILKNDVIVRKLRGHFQDVYLKLFPRNLRDIRIDKPCNKLLRYYPKKRRWDLLSQTFSKVFNQSILDSLIYFNKSFLPLFPSKDIKIKWAEQHYKDAKNNHYLIYFPPSKAIPLIKEKINVTSDIIERTTLVFLLLNNCAENNDLKSLEAVLSYICYRHRNEETLFRCNLLKTINHLFKLKNLNENHWKYINEQVTFLKLRNEFKYYCHFVFIQRYLEYLFVNGKPYKDEVAQYIKEVLLEHLSFRVDLENPQFEKEILMQINHFLSNNLKDDQESYAKHQTKLIIDIIDFNKQRPDYFIDIRNIPDLILSVYSTFNKPIKDINYEERTVIENILLHNMECPEKAIEIEDAKIMEIFTNIIDSFWLDRVLNQMVKKVNRSEFENEVFELFWDKLFCTDKYCNIVSWYFSHEPRSLLPHLEAILEKNLSRRAEYFKPSYIKLMSHLHFDTKLIELYVKKLGITDCSMEETMEGASKLLLTNNPSVNVFVHRNKIDYNKKEKAIKILSKVMSTDDYLKIVVEPFLPVKEKVDLQDAEVMEVYKLQCEVAKSLRHLQEPVKVLSTVIKFSLGDYLQSALPSLYSIFYRSPEKNLPPYIDVLAKRAVSARKHSIFLSCELLNFNYIVNLLKAANRINVSSEKHLFSATLKFFSKNPSEELLDLVISNLSSIDKNDKETLNSLVDVMVPEKYKTMYLEKCWKFFENMKEKDVDINFYLNSILDSLCSQDIMILLSREFCVYIVTNYFREFNEYLCKIQKFVIMFLRYRKSEQDENFKLFFEIVSMFKSEHRMTQIIELFYEFYSIAEDDVINGRKDEDRIRFIMLFEQGWTKVFQPMELFEEYVFLAFLIAKYKSPDPFVKNYAQNVVTFLDQLISEYGPLILLKIKSFLNQTLNFTEEKDKYVFFYDMLKIKTTPFYCLLVLELMERANGKSIEVIVIYNDILNILKKVNDPIVVLYCKTFHQVEGTLS